MSRFSSPFLPANPDNPTVVAPERVEIYRVVTAPEAAVPPASQIVGAVGALRGQIAVRRPDDNPPSATAPPQPLPGEAASFVEPVDSQAAGSWTYVAVGVPGP